MRWYRNSQKRYYEDGGIYFITSNTKDRYEYFNEDLLAKLLVEQIEHCRVFKKFICYGYKINPDHFHLLIMPTKVNYSIIMQFIKRHFTRDCNYILGYDEYNDIDRDIEKKYASQKASLLHHNKNITEIKEQFDNIYNKAHNIPLFKWQKSFHYHIIANENDLYNHIEYLKNQHIKHNLKENKFCYINEDI